MFNDFSCCERANWARPLPCYRPRPSRLGISLLPGFGEVLLFTASRTGFPLYHVPNTGIPRTAMQLQCEKRMPQVTHLRGQRHEPLGGQVVDEKSDGGWKIDVDDTRDVMEDRYC